MVTHRKYLRPIAMLCTALLVPGDVVLLAQQTPAAKPPATQTPAADPTAPPAPQTQVLPAAQLQSLVAPIALYPDPLLAQVLAASTYPLEIVQLQQWMAKHKDLKDKALADAVAKESWDPSVQGLAGLPEVVKQLADNIKWTSELGNAFLAQQSDVMDAVQALRQKATGDGKLKSTEQMKVETKVVETKTVVVIEQANPQVIYVPTYNPTVVWGAPIYAYPPVYYPPPGYYAAGLAISFGVGMAMGAMWGGGWGYGCGWGGNNVNINVNNNFNRNTNINGGNRNNIGNGSGNRGNGNWQHNPSHRGGAPYADRTTANKFGGSARGDSVASRQNAAGVSNRASGGAGGGGLGASNRAAGGAGGGGLSAGTSNRAAGGAGGGDRVGNQSVSSSSRGTGSFGGGSGGGFSGSSSRSSSSRGSSSMGSRGGGGGSRGGGGGRRR